MNREFSELKPGDKVVVYSWNYFGAKNSIKTVDEITSEGLIKVDGVLYYPNGEEISTDGCSKLEIWTKEKEDEIKTEKELNNKMKRAKQEFLRREFKDYHIGEK